MLLSIFLNAVIRAAKLFSEQLTVEYLEQLWSGDFLRADSASIRIGICLNKDQLPGQNTLDVPASVSSGGDQQRE